MKVILDSNILLSALISPHGLANTVFQAWRKNRFELITCQIQIDEIRRGSRYPKLKNILQPFQVGTILNYLYNTTIIDLPEVQRFTQYVNDIHDAYLLAIAQQSHADYLVTGDQQAELLQLKQLNRTRIVTLKEFCSCIQM